MRDMHRIVATCIIYKKPRRFFERPLFLVKKRAETGGGPYPGKWECVGGGLERADYEARKWDNHDGWENVLPRFVVRREVLEEVGLEKIGPARFLGDFAFIRSDDVPVIGLRYAAEYISGEVALDKEATAYVWITAYHVGDYDLIGTIASDIKRLDRELKSRWLHMHDWCKHHLLRTILRRQKQRAAYF